MTLDEALDLLRKAHEELKGGYSHQRTLAEKIESALADHSSDGLDWRSRGYMADLPDLNVELSVVPITNHYYEPLNGSWEWSAMGELVSGDDPNWKPDNWKEGICNTLVEAKKAAVNAARGIKP